MSGLGFFRPFQCLKRTFFKPITQSLQISQDVKHVYQSNPVRLLQKYTPFSAMNNLITKHAVTNVLPSTCRSIHTYTLYNSALTMVAKPFVATTRSVTRVSLTKGKRKSVRAVRLRFFRLQPGIWIRTFAGRHKKLWKKSAEMKARYRKHIFVTKAQSKMFEKMVQGYWKKPKYYIDDPYEPYRTRNNFLLPPNRIN